MKQFGGFPARLDYTAVPAMFFSSLLPEISDMAELKTTLYVLAAVVRKKGSPRFVTAGELLESASVVKSLGALGKAEEVLRGALKMAMERGTFIHIALDSNGKPEDVYLLNTAANRQAAERVTKGELKLGGLGAAPQIAASEPQPDIFTLYEQNIGMLTPMIADELRQAEKLYPAGWISDAVKVAVNRGKRNWSYISAVLERWSVEGKDDGAHQRDSKEGENKYARQKYGHMVQR